MNDLKKSLGRWIFEKEIWQIQLEDESGIDNFARSRDTSSFFLGDHIRILWQLGLLNADLIKCQTILTIDGLENLGKDDLGNHYYVDLREPDFHSEGWVDSAKGLAKLDRSINLSFHPFRYYILYKLDQILRLSYTPIQALMNSDGYSNLIKMSLERISSVTSQMEFVQNISFWDDTVALCIALEPCFHLRLFHQLKYSFSDGYDEQLKNISLHWNEMESILQKIGLEQIEKMRTDLCISAEMLDRNKDVHTLLRLTRGEKRFTKIHGKLGGAMVLLTMAELLRHSAEKAFKLKLKEEDELGFGMWVPGAKEKIYGTNRITDGDGSVKVQWLRVFGLEAGVRLKWYVEGETEYSAIDYAIGDFAPIEIINLRGKVAEKDKVSFRDSLKADVKSSRFSFISVDGDRSDYLRAVRKAAEDDDFCGMFFVSTPDFEFQNFTFDELEEILFKFCQDESPDFVFDRNSFHESLESSNDIEDLFAAVKKFTKNPYIKKGAEWGRRLMIYAQENPELETKTGEKVQRQIVEVIGHAVRACSSDYLFSRRDYRTDPQTGKVVKRQ